MPKETKCVFLFISALITNEIKLFRRDLRRDWENNAFKFRQFVLKQEELKTPISKSKLKVIVFKQLQDRSLFHKILIFMFCTLCLPILLITSLQNH